MRLTSTIALTIAIGTTAATNAMAADACKLLKQGTNTFCGTFVYSNGSPTDHYTAVFGPHNSFSIGPAFGTFSCPGRGFIEVDYQFSSLTAVWYGKAPSGAVNGTGYGKNADTNNAAYLYKWTLTPGACH